MLTRLIWIMIILGVTLSDHLVAKVCLNMIVKDETPVIRRCLESVIPLIDYWVIVDTGSSDGTQDLIREVMKDIPGELHERPWINFGHNRNEALQLALGKADYFLFIDADEKLLIADNFKMPPLDKDFYYIKTQYGGTNYLRVQLIKDSPEWKWVGVVHEVVHSDLLKTSGELVGVTNLVSTEGNRAKDPKRFHKDAALLEAALKEDPTSTRNMFYLAQSYRDAEENEKAVEAFQKRIAMGGWDEEIFQSLLNIARMQEGMGRDPQAIVDGYLKAAAYRPSRAEPLYYLANYYRRQGNNVKAYEVASKGITIPQSKDLLFVEKWIHEYGLLLEYSISAYWTDNYLQAWLASQLILAKEDLPKEFRECVERNMVWIDSKLKAPPPIQANEAPHVAG